MSEQANLYFSWIILINPTDRGDLHIWGGNLLVLLTEFTLMAGQFLSSAQLLLYKNETKPSWIPALPRSSRARVSAVLIGWYWFPAHVLVRANHEPGSAGS